MSDPAEPSVEPEDGSDRFKHLPEPVRLEDTVETKDTHVARDPEGGRDTDRDFMIRYSG
jgi:hypothetical protein